MVDIISKPWGFEEILEKNSFYVVKRLTMGRGHTCSLQYHQNKCETVYVIEGILKIFYGSAPDQLHEDVFVKGQFITIRPGIIHRMEAIEKSIYLESSTPQLDDVIRLQDNYGRTQ
jgi:mannose-6-phosphate isomerase-like protein (cupin superfamily)